MILSIQLKLSAFQIMKGQRLYSTIPLTLSFDKYSTKFSSKPPILMCHGLFGSKNNWPLLPEAVSSRLSRDVYAIDLRNHGNSPHSEEHTYKAMAMDLAQFIKEHALKKPILIGYSMGGKVAMKTALENPEIASKVISIDMPPTFIRTPSSIMRYCDIMKKIEDAAPSNKCEADEILAKYVPQVNVRKYLTDSLKFTSDKQLRFDYSYTTIRKSLADLDGSDVITQGSQFKGPALFISGGTSHFLEPFQEKKKEIKALFPNSKHEIVPGSNHLLIFEKTDTILNLITDFADE